MTINRSPVVRMSSEIVNEPSGSTEKNINLDSEKQALKPRDVDAALDYLNREDTTIMSEIDEKKLVRKIDWRIVPLMWMCYNLQYLDKTLSKRRGHSRVVAVTDLAQSTMPM